MYSLLLILAATKLIPAGIALAYWQKLKTSLRVFAILVWVGVVTETGLYLLAQSGSYNVPLIHVYSILEVALLAAFFWLEIKDFNIKRAIPIVTLATVVFSVVYACFGNNISQYPSLPRAMDAAVVVVLSLFLFFEMATTGDSHDPIKNGSYFINGAVLLYFTATFVTWVMMKYVIDDKNIVYALYGSHAWINAVCNLAYGYGLWISTRSYSFSI